MHDPRLGLLKISSWWSRPKVWPTSWHITRFLQAGVLYVAVLKYVSLTLVVPAVMWLRRPTQICAMPSHPLVPYAALQTSTLPLVGLQVGLLVADLLTGAFSTLEALQPFEVVSR